MLARANRIVRGDEYRTVVRRGVRSTGPHTVTYVRRSSSATPPRFGFIVAKTVGSAVTRNTVPGRTAHSNRGEKKATEEKRRVTSPPFAGT